MPKIKVFNQFSVRSKKKVFRDLVAIQDSLELLCQLEVHRSRKTVSQAYGIGLERLALIELEGIDCGWLDEYDELKRKELDDERQRVAETSAEPGDGPDGPGPGGEADRLGETVPGEDAQGDQGGGGPDAEAGG